MELLGERTITLDCDAIQADGGTRCASITGAYVALYDAIRWMKANRMLQKDPIKEALAAVSVGLVRREEVLDLDYSEDSTAGTDMNVVMTASGKFVEIQGTAESEPFGPDVLGKMLKLAKKGIDELIEEQNRVLSL